MRCRSIIVLALTLGIASLVSADIYRYRDANGRLVISNTPPPAAATVTVALPGAEGDMAAESPPAPEPKTFAFPDAKAPEPKETYKASLKRTHSNVRRSGSGNYIYVEGVLKNVGRGSAHAVRVEVRALDSRGRLVSIDDGYADPSTLALHQEASYQIMVSNDPRTERFETVWKWQNE